MKAWEIIGWTYDGAMYHDGCEPDVPEQTEDTEGKCPIFASYELSPDDCCDHCLHTWIAQAPMSEKRCGARLLAAWVFMVDP